MSEEGEDLTAVRELISWLAEFAQIQRNSGRIPYAEQMERYHRHLIAWVDCPIFGPRK